MMGRCPWSRDEYSLSKRGLPSPKIVMQHVCIPLQQVHSSFIFLPHIGHTVEILLSIRDKLFLGSVISGENQTYFFHLYLGPDFE